MEMNDEKAKGDFTLEDVIGSVKCGRWDKLYVATYVMLIVIGVFFSLCGGALLPYLYFCDNDGLLTLWQFILILVALIALALFSFIYSGNCIAKIKKGKALLRRCAEEGDLHRSSAEVIVTTESAFVGRGRRPAIITLRFKVDGKKYEKRNIGTITYAENYYNINILYSKAHDEVFLLKLK